VKTSTIQTLVVAALALAFTTATTMAQDQSHYDELSNMPFKEGYVAKDNVPTLLDESFFERGVQTYLWAVPALNMYGMKEGSEKVFGKGYNVLPIWKQRLNAKTLITTPNSDVIYAMGYLDLKEDGPIVIEVPHRGCKEFSMTSGNARFLLWARLTDASGLAMWACPARTEGRAATTWFCRRITPVTFRRAI
jgi:hypothetical protein